MARARDVTAVTEHVLVPIDDSPLARRALDFASTEHPGADLTILHAVDYVEESYGAEMLVGSEELRNRAREEAEELLAEARERTADHAGAVETVTKFGDPARTINDYADEHDVDLIVMGCHGRSVVSRVLLGSVAGVVVRRAPVPVTVVR
jgi:nucleotide-binding universal stress UspA family protein